MLGKIKRSLWKKKHTPDHLHRQYKLLGPGKMVGRSVDSKPKYFKGWPYTSDEKSPVLGTHVVKDQDWKFD